MQAHGAALGKPYLASVVIPACAELSDFGTSCLYQAFYQNHTFASSCAQPSPGHLCNDLVTVSCNVCCEKRMRVQQVCQLHSFVRLKEPRPSALK